jgi:hypothetical protein
MTIAAAVFARNIVLPTAVASQYLQPSGSVGIITHAVFANTTGGSISITAYVVPSGKTVADSAKLIPSFAVPALSSYVSPELAGVVLGAGDTLQCFSSSAGISLSVSGIKQS